MKLMTSCLAVGAVLLSLSPCLAFTCEERAALCVKAGGGVRCNDPSRLADCKRTHKFVAPTGRVWPATGRSGVSCEDHAAACLRQGGSAEACSSPAKLAACRKTGVWVGPSGKHYKAVN